MNKSYEFVGFGCFSIYIYFLPKVLFQIIILKNLLLNYTNSYNLFNGFYIHNIILSNYKLLTKTDRLRRFW